MKSLLPLIPFGVVAAAQCLAPRDDGPWRGGAFNPSIPWTPAAINAADGFFWVGLDTPSTLCPADSVDCPEWQTGQTVLIGGNNTVSMDVGVEGGQKLYIAMSGELSFTQAGDPTVPAGGIETGWSRCISQSGGAPTILSNSAGRFMACPVEGNDGLYKVFVQLDRGMGTSDCVGFQWRTYGAGSDASRAWAYD